MLSAARGGAGGRGKGEGGRADFDRVTGVFPRKIGLGAGGSIFRDAKARRCDMKRRVYEMKQARFSTLPALHLASSTCPCVSLNGGKNIPEGFHFSNPVPNCRVRLVPGCEMIK